MKAAPHYKPLKLVLTKLDNNPPPAEDAKANDPLPLNPSIHAYPYIEFEHSKRPTKKFCDFSGLPAKYSSRKVVGSGLSGFGAGLSKGAQKESTTSLCNFRNWDQWIKIENCSNTEVDSLLAYRKKVFIGML